MNCPECGQELDDNDLCPECDEWRKDDWDDDDDVLGEDDDDFWFEDDDE